MVIFYWNILDIRAVPLLHGKRLCDSAKKCDNLCNTLPRVTWRAHFYAIQMWENCILAYFVAPFPLILSDLPFRTRNLYKSSMKGAKKWKRLRNKRCKTTEGNVMSEMCGKCHFTCSAGFWSAALTLKFYFGDEELKMLFFFNFFSLSLWKHLPGTSL